MLSRFGWISAAVVLLAIISTTTAHAQEVKRWLEMSYVCGRDRSGQVAIAKVNRPQVYEVVSWQQPFQRSYQMGSRSATAELFNFQFNCGAAGAVHVMDIWLTTSAAQRLRAFRRGNSIAFTSGTQRVQVGTSASQCNAAFSQHRNFDQYALCMDRARAPVQQQVWTSFPPNTAPLPGFARITNRANISPGLNMSASEACKRFPNLC